MTTTADGHHRSPSQAELLAFLIHNLKIAFNANRTIAKNRQFCSCHESLREMLSLALREVTR